MIKKLKKDYRHGICLGAILISLLISVVCFRYATLRIVESIVDVFYSTCYYVIGTFRLDYDVTVTVNEFTQLPFKMPWNLPNSWEEFKVLCEDFGELLFTVENLKAYFNMLLEWLLNVSQIILILQPFVIAMILLGGNDDENINNDYDVDSKQLRRWKRFEKKMYLPIKNWIIRFVGFLEENSVYVKMFLLIWAFSFNFFAVAIEIVAYYIYFVLSFDFVSLYIQILKLLMDLSCMLDFLPGIAWFLITLVVINIVRRNIGYDNLNHMEMKNRGFLNERPIALLAVGTVGKKKTTLITDMALSEEVILRNKAFEKLLETDLKFPYFPWINLENSLKKAILSGYVKNLEGCRRFVLTKKLKFEKHPHQRNLFYYNYNRYGFTYQNELYVTTVWEAIETYCQLYFIYVMESSLIISNYAIRTDDIIDDVGNFPMRNTDFFKRDARLIESFSRHSHILDQNTLRLGKKLASESVREEYAEIEGKTYKVKYSTFEFGIIVMTEVGKDRGNNLENQTVKKTDENANQKNDLWNAKLKLVRHLATVDNYPFVKILCDEQRPESFGADARDLYDVVHIVEGSPLRLAMPLFALEDLIITWIYEKFDSKYRAYRYYRGDNTLKMYLLRGIVGALYNYRTRIYNLFGYYEMQLGVESGRLDGQIQDKQYYLMPKKIYSKRFKTDCYREFLNKDLKTLNTGIEDIPEYESIEPSYEEFLQQNSYFVNELKNLNRYVEENVPEQPEADNEGE